MQRQSINNQHYIRAQKVVKELGKELRSIPEEVLGNEEILLAMQ